MTYVVKCFTTCAMLTALLGTGAAWGDEKQIRQGDRATEFQCLDDQGQVWRLQDHIGQRPLVVYFYPSDFAFCCTRQACRYRDRQRDFAELGAEIIGISSDSVEAHRLFKESHQLACTLLADVDGNVARQFGVPLRTGGKCMPQDDHGKALVDQNGKPLELARQFTAARWTFIIGRDGQVVYRDTGVSPIKDHQEVLDFLRRQDAK